MATTNTTIYNRQSGVGASPILPSVMDFGGKLRAIRLETTVAALGATSDILNVCKLPVGARVLPTLSKITCESPGTAVTVKLGDSTNDSRYMASNALGGGARDLFLSAFPGTDSYVSTPVAAGAAETLILTSITITAPTAAAKVNLIIVYELE